MKFGKIFNRIFFLLFFFIQNISNIIHNLELKNRKKISALNVSNSTDIGIYRQNLIGNVTITEGLLSKSKIFKVALKHKKTQRIYFLLKENIKISIRNWKFH